MTIKSTFRQRLWRFYSPNDWDDNNDSNKEDDGDFYQENDYDEGDKKYKSGGENRVMNESLCFVRRKTLYPHRASLRPVVYMNRNGQKVWKASWNVLARIFPRGCHLSFQFLNSRKQSEWQKVVFLIFPPRLSRPYLGCQLRVISSSYIKMNIMSSFSHLTLPEDYFAKPYQIL